MASDQESGSRGARRASRAEAVRSAVDQAFKATAGQGAAAADTGRERAQDIIDQLAQAAGRVRDVLDELRPPTGDELEELGSRLADLERRVAALEAAQTAEPEAKGKPAGTRRATGTRSSAKTAGSARTGKASGSQKRSTSSRRKSGS
jgi:ABC-type transporter Mla subunit MlaD